MFKISRLYFKLYLYLVAVIFILSGVPALVFFLQGPPPHIKMYNDMISVTYSVINSSSGEAKLKRELIEIGKNAEIEIIIYNHNGEPLIWTGENKPLSDRKIIDELNKNERYATDIPYKRMNSITFRGVNKDSKYAFIRILQTKPPPFLSEFLITLIITCLALSILLYPLALYLSSPLQKITEKANKISKGDFRDTKIDIKGNDEIADLNNAFTVMSKELISRIEEKKELILAISHELGTPLSRMQVATEIIKDKQEAGEMPTEKIVKKLSRNIDEMSTLLKELLDFGRMDKSTILNKSKFNMEEVLMDTLEKLNIFIEEKNIKIKVEIEGNVDKVLCDRVKIARVIKNLLTNAIDYTPSNSKITINLKGDSSDFSFSIKDEGPGILERNKEKIFEPFFREDTSRTRTTGGTGLGLAIVKKIIDLHDGKISVANPGEEGAKIIFVI